jgi:hypothetical protein
MKRIAPCVHALAAILAMIFMVSHVQAMKLNHQGMLTDSGSNPITGNVSIRFTLHDSESDPTELWAETQSVCREYKISPAPAFVFFYLI